MAILTKGYNPNKLNIHLLLHWNGTGIAAQMPKREETATFLMLHHKYYKYMKETASEQ